MPKIGIYSPRNPHMIDHLPPSAQNTKLRPLSAFIFMSRWLQLPLYLGLILAQCVYVSHFWVELSDLIGAVFGNDAALQHVLTAVAVPAAPCRPSSTKRPSCWWY